MGNIQVTFETSLDNARSESSLAINPNNPQQVVGVAKRFINPKTYDFTIATSFSTDGGFSWNKSADLALLSDWSGISDPALAWDDSGNVSDQIEHIVVGLNNGRVRELWVKPNL